MVDPRQAELSITRQYALIGISRSVWYGPGKAETLPSLTLMKIVDAQFMEAPFDGIRQMARHLRNQGCCIGHKRTRRLMAKMGLRAVHQEPKTTVPLLERPKYPCLLIDLVIECPNHVCCASIYIPMRRGFLYPVAMMGWGTRRVLSW